jgi:nickel transport protein
MQCRICTLWLLVACGSLLLVVATPAFAHGVNVEHTVQQTVALVARYDTGEPMANAHVTVYAPNDPTTPWETGTCDELGRYQFVPDPTLVGTWEVQVRLAGHGDTMYVTIGSTPERPASTAALLPASRDTPYTPLQLLLMGGAVVWGCVGTALFFASRKG